MKIARLPHTAISLSSVPEDEAWHYAASEREAPGMFQGKALLLYGDRIDQCRSLCAGYLGARDVEAYISLVA